MEDRVAMEQTPKRILTALEKSGAVSGFRLTNLQEVAESLTEDCNLKDITVDTLAGLMLVSVRTAKDYLSVFKHAHAYLAGKHTEKIIGKAKAKVFPYLGVYSLLAEPKPVRTVKTFKEVKQLDLTPQPPKPKQVRTRKKRVPLAPVTPSELKEVEDQLAPSLTIIRAMEAQVLNLTKELEVERSLTEELQDQKTVLTDQLNVAKDVVQRMLRIENMTNGLCSLTFKNKQHLLDQVARYFENLVDIIGATSAINVSEGLKLISESLDETGFPTHTLWQQRSWAKIVRTPEFKEVYLQLSPRAQSEMKNALFHLSLNYRHPSLRSRKMEVNPRGIPSNAWYTWASDKVRFYWSVEFAPQASGKESVLTLHRLELKRG
jgi:hypothetical protein